MQFQIERKSLLAGLQQVLGVVEKRSTMPMLSHILITANSPENSIETGISIFATDLEISISDDYPAHVIVPGQMTVPGKKLLEITRELPDGMVKMSLQENNWISVEAGKAYFKITGLPSDEFPTPSFLDEEGSARISISAELFSRLIRKTIFATGENDPRYILNGLLLETHKVTETKQMIRLVATDGNRLALAEEAVKDHQGLSIKEQVIVPKKALLEIKRLLDETAITDPEQETDIRFGKNLLTLKSGTARFSSRLLNGNYPNYNLVIPKENNNHVSANKELLLGALTRVSILSDEKTSLVKTTVNPGQIEFRAKNHLVGEASETVPTSFEGEPFTTFFSARYLRDILLATDDSEIVFEFKDTESACLIREKSGRYLSLLMPVDEK